jgi:hypothetical protein
LLSWSMHMFHIVDYSLNKTIRISCNRLI